VESQLELKQQKDQLFRKRLHGSMECVFSLRGRAMHEYTPEIKNFVEEL
jgi:hypothetical protein